MLGAHEGVAAEDGHGGVAGELCAEDANTGYVLLIVGVSEWDGVWTFDEKTKAGA